MSTSTPISQTTPQIVKISAIRSGFAVSFPYELKDDFRKSFPSSKWNALSKCWEVGPRSKRRLDDWASIVNASNLHQQLTDLEAAELSQSEQQRLLDAIRIAEREVAEKQKNISAESARIQALLVTLDTLEAKRAELAVVAEELRSAREAAKGAEAAVAKRLEGAIDLDRLQRAAHEMDRWHGQVGYPAHAHFDELKAEFVQAKHALASAGLSCAAINWCAKANFNRRDRDGIAHMPIGAWFDVQAI